MSPYECVYGAAPNMKWLKIRGVIVTRSSLREVGEKTSTKKPIQDFWWDTGYLVLCRHSIILLCRCTWYPQLHR